MKDLTGETFHRWTFIGPYTETAKDERKWLGRCECGTEKAYSFGTYSTIEEATEARRKGEELRYTATAENPVSIRVERDGYGELNVRFEPAE